MHTDTVEAQDVAVVAGVSLLVPIKPLSLAKSRLLGAADDGAGSADAHACLVAAVARDTVAAARQAAGVREIVVISSDPRLTESFRADGIEVLPDTPTAGLNAALRHGDAHVRARGYVSRTGALQADLPALRPSELAQALETAGDNRAFCPDRHGTGTTLLIARPGRPLNPRFGTDSATAHAASAVRLDGPWESLRCDVDTGQDLDTARELGLGAHTRACLSPALHSDQPM